MQLNAADLRPCFLPVLRRLRLSRAVAIAIPSADGVLAVLGAPRAVRLHPEPIVGLAQRQAGADDDAGREAKRVAPLRVHLQFADATERQDAPAGLEGSRRMVTASLTRRPWRYIIKRRTWSRMPCRPFLASSSRSSTSASFRKLFPRSCASMKQGNVRHAMRAPNRKSLPSRDHELAAVPHPGIAAAAPLERPRQRDVPEARIRAAGINANDAAHMITEQQAVFATIEVAAA